MLRINKNISQITDMLAPLSVPGGQRIRDGQATASAQLSSHLLEVFNQLEDKFPAPDGRIAILSLACGIPDEFFALRVFFNRKGIKVDFVGVDIQEKRNKQIEELFKPLASHGGNTFRILTGDASNIEALQKLLSDAGCLPASGFPFVMCRHPDVINYPDVFGKIITEVIPFFSSAKSKTFVCLYNPKIELSLTEAMVARAGVFSMSSGSQYAPRGMPTVTDGAGRTNTCHAYNFICPCAGFALKKKLALETVCGSTVNIVSAMVSPHETKDVSPPSKSIANILRNLHMPVTTTTTLAPTSKHGDEIKSAGSRVDVTSAALKKLLADDSSYERAPFSDEENREFRI